MRIDTDKVDDDVHAGLEEAGRVGDKDMKNVGKDHVVSSLPWMPVRL